MANAMDFTTAHVRSREELVTDIDSHFGPVRYDDTTSRIVARIIITWDSGAIDIEEYRSLTQARMRRDTLMYLWKGEISDNIRRVEYEEVPA